MLNNDDVSLDASTLSIQMIRYGISLVCYRFVNFENLFKGVFQQDVQVKENLIYKLASCICNPMSSHICNIPKKPN